MKRIDVFEDGSVALVKDHPGQQAVIWIEGMPKPDRIIISDEEYEDIKKQDIKELRFDKEHKKLLKLKKNDTNKE
jgi:hypothetical protein